MSFFLGLAKGFMWAQEKKQEKEMFEAEMAWEREKLLLSAKISRQNAAYSSSLKRQEDTAEKIKLITSLTGNPAVAETLAKTGMLDTVLMNLERDDVDQAQYLKSISEGLSAMYGNDPEKIAEGLAAASGETDPNAAAVAAVSATSSPDDWLGIVRSPPRAVDRTDANAIEKRVDDFLARSGNFSSLTWITDPSDPTRTIPTFSDKNEKARWSEARSRLLTATMEGYTNRDIGWNDMGVFLEGYGSEYLGLVPEPTTPPPSTVDPAAPPPAQTGVLTTTVTGPPSEEDEFTSSVFRRDSR